MITKKHYDNYLQWFNNYVKGFKERNKKNIDGILIKEEHTHNVVKYAENIAQSIGLNGSDILLAKICALFHDVGRFRQFEKYGTFADARSENHATLGLDILGKFNLLESIDENYANIIRCAIANHNVKDINDKLLPKELTFVHILRDADKLDIWRIVTDYYESMRNGKKSNIIEIGLSDTGIISQNIMNKTTNGQIISYEEMKSLSDFKICQIMWVYDLNFRESYKILNEKMYLEKIIKYLPNENFINEVYENAKNYLNGMLV